MATDPDPPPRKTVLLLGGALLGGQGPSMAKFFATSWRKTKHSQALNITLASIFLASL
jgi:hypothetical protein